MMQSISAIRSGFAARRGLAALPNADYCEHAWVGLWVRYVLLKNPS